MDRMSSIQLALKNEATEMEFYLQQATIATNPVTKALFFELAKDERTHMEHIEALHKALVVDGLWPADVALDVAGTNIVSVLAAVERDTTLRASPDAGEIEALRKSIEFEQAGAAFYERLATMCENPREVEFFEFLAAIEADHMASIKDTLLYLENPEVWTEKRERIALDGG